jgi:hypothetical protein
MPRHSRPKLIATEAGNQRADLALAVQDLERVAACCLEIRKRDAHPLTDLISGALFDSAIVRYGRCFTKGQRFPLKSFLRRLTSAERELHDFVMALRNRYLAHSENEFETMGTTIHVATGEDGKLVRGGLGLTGSGTLGVGLEHIARFQGLAVRLNKLVREKIDELDAVVRTHIDKLSDHELLALDDGFAPTPATVNVNKARTWPPKNRSKIGAK